MNFTREDITFPSGDGHCAGDLYLPEGVERPPVVVMAHGIGALRSFRLDAFAERFAARGMAVLVFDYRNFGDSPGEPRCLVSPSRHVADYLAAMAHVRNDSRVDGNRLGLWGTSFSGGHVIAAAARDGNVQAVVSQVPFVSGPASALVYPFRYLVPAFSRAIADGLAGAFGRGPVMIPVVRRSGAALLASEDSWDGYLSMVPDDTDWPGEVPARILLTLPLYRPVALARQVTAPTLMVVAQSDTLCPASAARRAANRIEGCRYAELPIGHFDAYDGDWFEKVVTMEGDFLEEQLAAAGGRAGQ